MLPTALFSVVGSSSTLILSVVVTVPASSLFVALPVLSLATFASVLGVKLGLGLGQFGLLTASDFWVPGNVVLVFLVLTLQAGLLCLAV